jgi:hypothetical protein
MAAFDVNAWGVFETAAAGAMALEDDPINWEIWFCNSES